MITISAISRTPTSSPRDSARGTIPTGEKILLGSQIIIDAVAGNMRSGHRLWPDKAVGMANAQIASDQRFFQVELDQAAEQLTIAFPASAAPYGTDQITWRMLIGNKLAWRVVSITACRAGFVMDPVSKACVQWRAAPSEREAAPLLPEPEEALLLPKPEEADAKTGTPILLIAAVAVVALLLFR